LFNVESFPKEKFVSLDAALDRAGSSLNVLRKEVFTLYFLAFEFAILSGLQMGNADMEAVRNVFMIEALEFVSKNADRWGPSEHFLLRVHSCRNALSSYLGYVKESGGGGNIIEPIKQIFWPSVMNHETTG
jgi:hypothetical protein